MTRTDLIKLLTKLEMAPSKKMGQNFLIDPNFPDCILRTAKIGKSDRILEVGPGFGALTERLLDSGASVTAVELDRKLAAWLRTHLVPRGLTLIEGDACRIPIPQLFPPPEEFRLISNLPYSAGTVVVANLLELEHPPLDMLIMLQKEVAERFAAKEGTDAYSSLSVRIQTAYDVELVRLIPPEVFYPKPEVDSALVRLTRRADIPDTGLRKVVSRLARTAFAHRRKKMFKQIASVFGADEVRSALAELAIDSDLRAERLSVASFLALAKRLSL